MYIIYSLSAITLKNDKRCRLVCKQLLCCRLRRSKNFSSLANFFALSACTLKFFLRSRLGCLQFFALSASTLYPLPDGPRSNHHHRWSPSYLSQLIKIQIFEYLVQTNKITGKYEQTEAKTLYPCKSQIRSQETHYVARYNGLSKGQLPSTALYFRLFFT